MSDERPIRYIDGGSGITMDQVKRYGPIILISIAALLFIVQNADSVSLEFLWFNFQWPLWIMLVAFGGLGALIFYAVQRRRQQRASRPPSADR
jgi:uncharacterized integral membrane protein